MELKDIQQWITAFHKKEGWNHQNARDCIGYLAEETGEVARAVRKLEVDDRPQDIAKSRRELRMDLAGELGDVLDCVVAIANKYDLTLDKIFEVYQRKMVDRLGDINTQESKAAIYAHKYVDLLNKGIQKYGEDIFYDEGISKIMNMDSIYKELLTLPVEDVRLILLKILKFEPKNGRFLVEACLYEFSCYEGYDSLFDDEELSKCH